MLSDSPFSHFSLFSKGARFVALIGLAFLLFAAVKPAAAQATGGFMESVETNVTRPLLTEEQIESFMPSRGSFTFPAPYNTQGVRITNASDCGGQDCVGLIYSYWRNMSNSANSNIMYIFIGLDGNAQDPDRGGSGPTLFSYNKTTGELTKMGPLFEPSSPYSWHSGEGWYFSHSMATKLYIRHGSKLMRYDVLTHDLETVFDSTTEFPGTIIRQASSSNDDTVHAATLKDASNYEPLGCVVYNSNTQQFSFFPAGDGFDEWFDECHIDKSGRYLVLKEHTANTCDTCDLDNVIVDLETGTQTVLLDQNGAGGHSALGYGWYLAADNFSPSTWRLWDLSEPLTKDIAVDDDLLQGGVVYHIPEWNNTFSPAHVSFENARPDVPISQQYACGSSANPINAPHANEVICFSLDSSIPMASEQVLVVAPVMTDMNASNGNTIYAMQPKGNIDPTGEYFFWTSNTDGGRIDAFMVKIPSQLITGGGNTGGEVQSVVWANLVNLTANGNSLQKTGGCDGCADATANSQQQIDGDGYLEFTASETNTLRAVGLAPVDSYVSLSSMPYAIRLQAGYAGVREYGAYRADVPFVSGDVFRISVNAGVVTYSKNGTVFYTSSVEATSALQAEASIFDLGGTITNAMIKLSAQSVPATGSVAWINLVNLTASGNTLEKTGGCNGCEDATANSQQQIDGDGYLEFTASETNTLRAVGLAPADSQVSLSSMPYAIRLQAGYAGVREYGVYQADVPFASGDVFRISVSSGVVTYSKNGIVFYTSNVAATNPLRAEASIFDLGGTITNAVINTQ